MPAGIACMGVGLGREHDGQAAAFFMSRSA
jgi:hypothetical protein